MASHISRISLLESTVSRLESSSAPKSDLDSLRQEYRKLLEAEHLDGLNVKAHVWALGASALFPSPFLSFPSTE